MKSLTNKSLLWFIGCTVCILLICTPLFYFLTKHFYAEEMVDVIESLRRGEDIPPSDLEKDIMTGVMIQFALIIVVLSVASVVTMRFVFQRLWRPYYDTMNKIKRFDLEKDTVPEFTTTDVQEFATLNSSLTELLKRNRETFQHQKEFTQNASHELQTPLAIIKSKLDLLLQEDLKEPQLKLVQDMYDVSGRMARLNRNLLLLAKIDNHQYDINESVNLPKVLSDSVKIYETLYEGHNIVCSLAEETFIKANAVLLEILTNNLIVNAIRNTSPNGLINIACSMKELKITNTAMGEALDGDHIFNRFNHTSDINRGNGIGLSIVKAICDYHGWRVVYSFLEGEHTFTVYF